MEKRSRESGEGKSKSLMIARRLLRFPAPMWCGVRRAYPYSLSLLWYFLSNSPNFAIIYRRAMTIPSRVTATTSDLGCALTTQPPTPSAMSTNHMTIVPSSILGGYTLGAHVSPNAGASGMRPEKMIFKRDRPSLLHDSRKQSLPPPLSLRT